MDYIKRKDVYEAEFFCRDLDVSQDNVVRAISVFVDYLDLKEFKFIYSEPKKFGRKSYDPKDMLKLHIYGYVRNIRSCRTLEYAAKDSTSFKWLLGELTPHYKTISNFKKDNIDSIKLVFKAFMEYCIEMGLADVELIAVDGMCNRTPALCQLSFLKIPDHCSACRSKTESVMMIKAAIFYRQHGIQVNLRQLI